VDDEYCEKERCDEKEPPDVMEMGNTLVMKVERVMRQVRRNCRRRRRWIYNGTRRSRKARRDVY
jgi:hypothetical protein